MDFGQFPFDDHDTECTSDVTELFGSHARAPLRRNSDKRTLARTKAKGSDRFPKVDEVFERLNNYIDDAQPRIRARS